MGYFYIIYRIITYLLDEKLFAITIFSAQNNSQQDQRTPIV
jgi:hypothetical protein